MMLKLLLEILPTEFNEIEQSYQQNNLVDLAQRLHRLHGAVCYCSVPALKNAIIILEKALKKNDFTHLAMHFSNFEKEIQRLLKS